MNAFNNKRRQETVRRIKAAFLELLKDREIGQVNVSQLCKMAQINRGTFYANFEDVYQLAEVVLQQLEEEVGTLLERDIQKPYSENDFLKLFEHIRGNQELYRVYFRLGNERAREMSIFSVTFPEETENLDLHITFFMSGFNAMVRKWLESGCRQTPEEMLTVLVREYNGRLCWKLP